MLRYATALVLLSTAAIAGVPAPQTIVLISCRVNDLTGQEGRQDPNFAAKDWRDLEWRQNPKDFSLECRRDVIPLEDAVSAADPTVKPLVSDFSKPEQCGRAGAMFMPSYVRKGWAVLTVGCPTKVVNEKGEIVGWHMPECPSYIPGTDTPMKCKFDESLI
jgi:hypothetical protein